MSFMVSSGRGGFGGLRSNPRDPQTGERDVHLRWPVAPLGLPRQTEQRCEERKAHRRGDLRTTPFRRLRRRASIPSTPWLTKMVKSLLTRFVSIEGTDGSDGASHHRNLGLSEPVDALLHVPDNANGRVPRSQGSSRVVGMRRRRPHNRARGGSATGLCPDIRR